MAQFKSRAKQKKPPAFSKHSHYLLLTEFQFSQESFPESLVLQRLLHARTLNESTK